MREKAQLEAKLNERLHNEQNQAKIEVTPFKLEEYDKLRKEFFDLYENKFWTEARAAKKLKKEKIQSENLVIKVKHKFKLSELLQEWIGDKNQADFVFELDDSNRYKWLKKWDVQFQAIIEGE
jgi:hypothetical protein